MLLPNNSWPKSQRNNNRPSLAASTVCVYCRSCESCQDSSPVLGERVANLYKIECRHERQLRLLLPHLSLLLMVKFLVSATRRRHTDANVQIVPAPPPSSPLLAPAFLLVNSHFIWQADGINNCLASSASGAVIGQCASDGKISLQETSLIEIPMQRRRSLMGMPAATRSVGHSQTHTHSHAHTLPRRILANLSQIIVEHAHAAEKELEKRQEKEPAGAHTNRTTGATSTAIFVILIVHCMCNMQHILPQLSAPPCTSPILVLRLRNCSHVTRTGLGPSLRGIAVVHCRF